MPYKDQMDDIANGFAGSIRYADDFNGLSIQRDAEQMEQDRAVLSTTHQNVLRKVLSFGFKGSHTLGSSDYEGYQSKQKNYNKKRPKRGYQIW